METPNNNITGYQDFGTTLREQKHAALLNCVPVFVDNLNAAGYELAEFFNALSTHLDRIGHPQSVIKTLEELAQDFEKKS
jgi:hypothetical protein